MFYTYIYIYTSNKFKSLTSATGVSRKLPNGLILRETQSSTECLLIVITCSTDFDIEHLQYVLDTIYIYIYIYI